MNEIINITCAIIGVNHFYFLYFHYVWLLNDRNILKLFVLYALLFVVSYFIYGANNNLLLDAIKLLRLPLVNLIIFYSMVSVFRLLTGREPIDTIEKSGKNHKIDRIFNTIYIFVTFFFGLIIVFEFL